MAICSQNTDNHSSTHFSQYKEPMQSSGMGRGLKRDSSLVVHNEHDSTNVVPRVNFTVVLAATNRLEDLDEAVLRRFESKILVDLPESMYREQLFEKFLIGVEHHLTSENFSSLASLTEGWSCSDIEVKYCIPSSVFYN